MTPPAGGTSESEDDDVTQEKTAIVCSETYYPAWSSRGIRGVRCTRPAKKLLIEGQSEPRPVCGIHVRRHAPYGGRFAELPA